MQNLLIVHGGGPSAVLNASLFGVIREAKRQGIPKIYGAVGGSEGILKESFWELERLTEEELELMLYTPGSVIGTSRYELTAKDYERMPNIFKRYQIGYVLLNGGNGTMDTCGKIGEVCQEQGICVMGIPKTVDNDIAITDHTPGFGSAACFLAEAVREIGADVRSLPIHVCIVEAMGRNAGWLTGASALAREEAGDAPHLIYFPERPFREEEFIEDVKGLYEEKGGVVVVASEGLRGEDGKPVVPLIYSSGRAEYFGDVGAYLAELVIKRLGIKARSEKPGLLGRTAISMRSKRDLEEAILVGEEAVKAAIEGKTKQMVGLFRKEMKDNSYQVYTKLVPVEEVMLYEKKLPDTYMNERGNDVTEEYLDWLRPLVGDQLQKMLRLKKGEKEKKANEAHFFKPETI